jgi:hypothetical protein
VFFIKEHGSLLFLFQDCICGLWYYSVVNGYAEVKGHELSMFFLDKQAFVAFLHLICKEPDLESDLIIPSSGTSWGLSRF